jgi:hypothetical protein
MKLDIFSCDDLIVDPLRAIGHQLIGEGMLSSTALAQNWEYFRT